MTDSGPTRPVAIDALGQLGLSKYEAAVFIALQQLETGTASEVDRITDVPRSQVYGAAERLNELGLIDIQQSNPIQYRAIGLETARKRLRKRREEQERRAFDYLHAVQGEHAATNETQVGVWTVTGKGPIDDRIVDLITRADDRILFGAPEQALVSDVIVETLTAAAEDVQVTVLSEDPAVCEQFDSTPVATHIVTDRTMIEGQRGRILAVDSETVLFSTLGGPTRSSHEAAIWSDGTSVAAIFIGLLDDWVEQCLR
ncbi:TrmB family transcriptional regulator [Halocatena pleomorpha]|uniref:TrmB family transcriptional regulator n=1 Tax=Halocatena pleomorpha TaxID=1785090 RepID=A0A3P3R9L6_9EURY|nr:helix-turn-helix domain-containing protein [Halocatena pleomorpha]RRJ29173.1 TrmB family transcriptional regulator [Halocatena pleomorpha]